jgi:hypothetical protein
MLWPMATTDYLRRTGSVPVASWRRANSWWTHIYWESILPPYNDQIVPICTYLFNNPYKPPNRSSS